MTHDYTLRPMDVCCRKHTPLWWGMYLCRTCGNKRCPHASDCSLDCTNSNAPGQKGSAYEDCK